MTEVYYQSELLDSSRHSTRFWNQERLRHVVGTCRRLPSPTVQETTRLLVQKLLLVRVRRERRTAVALMKRRRRPPNPWQIEAMLDPTKDPCIRSHLPPAAQPASYARRQRSRLRFRRAHRRASPTTTRSLSVYSLLHIASRRVAATPRLTSSYLRLPLARASPSSFPLPPHFRPPLLTRRTRPSPQPARNP